MRVIIDVPDALFDDALAVLREEMRDYARRYDRPGWGWMFFKNGRRYWCRGIKGGLSVSLSKAYPADPPPLSAPLDHVGGGAAGPEMAKALDRHRRKYLDDSETSDRSAT